MNMDLLSKHLENYRKILNDEKTKNDYQERKERVDYYKSWTKEKIAGMSLSDFEEYISKMWAMLIWGNKKYKIDQIISVNTFDKIKAELAELLWSNKSIDIRWDRFREAISGFGPAMISELLCLTHPDEYMLWNRRAYVALNYLGIKELPRYDYQLDGTKYKELCHIAKEIMAHMIQNGFKEVDLLFVDYFIWEELQVEQYLSRIHKKLDGEKVKQTTLDKEETKTHFIHDDIKNKIAEIGQWLGFTTATERKVAEGAVIDTVWEATIGNMGRVIYVFEIQTKGSIDSLLMNLLRALNNPAVQGVVAVSDEKQLQQIMKEAKEISGLANKLKAWNYEEVLANHEALAQAFESINRLKLVPQGF